MKACATSCLLCGAAALQAQHITTIYQDHGSSDRGTSSIVLEVPPGFSFLSSVYIWTDIPAGTGGVAFPVDYSFENGIPVDWIDASQGFTQPGPGSFDCGTPIMVTIPINAPAVIGSYDAVLVDNNGNYDPILIQLLVVEEPSYVDFVFQDTVFVDETGTNPGIASGLGIDIACLFDHTPTDSIAYSYMFYPPAPWLTQEPMEVMVAAWENASVELTYQATVPGDFVTYRYRSQSWYTNPQILKYQMHVELSTGIADQTGSAIHIANNPVTDLLVVLNNSKVVRYELLSIEGQRISTGQIHGGRNEIDMNGTASGIYLLRTEMDGSIATQRIIKQ